MVILENALSDDLLMPLCFTERFNCKKTNLFNSQQFAMYTIGEERRKADTEFRAETCAIITFDR